MTNRLDGRVAVITGASSGVGAAAARKLSALGATVAVVGRSAAKTNAVASEIGAEAFTVDFASLAGVRKLADALLDRYPRIDILANNAGGQALRFELTEDGHETTFQINYLAPFLLTQLLIDRLAESDDARVISTSSSRHSAGRITIDDLNGENTRYRPFAAYGNWKLGNVLFTRELARRTEGTSITATAFHPGAVASDFFRNDGGPLATVLKSRILRKLMITPDHGADPLVHLATLDNPRAVNGAYFDRLTHREPKGAQATDDDLARRLWDRTADLLK
jgi:NAD(P)-dependent dehydrogenase (short-subunit alcohol dehydrogenase family)